LITVNHPENPKIFQDPELPCKNSYWVYYSINGQYDSLNWALKDGEIETNQWKKAIQVHWPLNADTPIVQVTGKDSNHCRIDTAIKVNFGPGEAPDMPEHPLAAMLAIYPLVSLSVHFAMIRYSAGGMSTRAIQAQENIYTPETTPSIIMIT
jgi:hypothetical protein